MLVFWGTWNMALAWAFHKWWTTGAEFEDCEDTSRGTEVVVIAAVLVVFNLGAAKVQGSQLVPTELIEGQGDGRLDKAVGRFLLVWMPFVVGIGWQVARVRVNPRRVRDAIAR